MKSTQGLLAIALILGVGASTGQAGAAEDADVVDVAHAALDAKAVAEGLFPEGACDQLKAAGFRCMGFRPALRYELPAAAFKPGSAELPEGLKKQLIVFAEVLKARKGSGKIVLIEGYTDARGIPAINVALSQRRANAVKDYLVAMGADASMLSAVGRGSAEPRNAADPFSPENRRVEIRREVSMP